MKTTVIHYPDISPNEIASICLDILVSYLFGLGLFSFTLYSQTDRNFFSSFNVCSFILLTNYSCDNKNSFCFFKFFSVSVELCCDLNKICIESNINI